MSKPKKTNFKIGDRVLPSNSLRASGRKFGVVTNISIRDYCPNNRAMQKHQVCQIQWHNQLSKSFGLIQTVWGFSLEPYEPRRHPLTSIFQDLPIKKTRKRVGKNKKKA